MTTSQGGENEDQDGNEGGRYGQSSHQRAQMTGPTRRRHLRLRFPRIIGVLKRHLASLAPLSWPAVVARRVLGSVGLGRWARRHNSLSSRAPTCYASIRKISLLGNRGGIVTGSRLVTVVLDCSSSLEILVQNGFHVEDHVDLVTDDHPCSRQLVLPRHTELMPVDPCAAFEASTVQRALVLVSSPEGRCSNLRKE